MNMKSLIPVTVAAATLPTFALAQDAAVTSSAEMIWIMNTLLFLIGGFSGFLHGRGLCHARRRTGTFQKRDHADDQKRSAVFAGNHRLLGVRL